MPGFLGGSGGASGGAGGEITFPKEFIDPVTKLRVSQPENLIDTDFEYGLQPTKWETVELINNTPSFFSKSGDTTIPGILSITTTAGTREIIVNTALDHGLAVGIPINVQGTKSVTADGSYIINSIPDTRTFTYLSRDLQENTSAIEDLYTSIITGEFFQGSQLRIAEADGIVTDAGSPSVLTVTTENPHGFGPNTPFYFLNLNSTISQEFEAANTAAKSFDSSNSATAQSFDGSNTLSSLNIDWSNSATVGGATSTVNGANSTNNTITVAHGTENFVGLPIGQPLYYDVSASLGYFSVNPRGVVFLKTNDSLDVGSSTFQVSQVPDGAAINIESNVVGTFQIANQARTFAGNNRNALTETTIDVLQGPPQVFDATNASGVEAEVTGYSGGQITVESSTFLDWYQGAMVFYSTTGSAASGLTDETTYFVDSFFRQGVSDLYSFTLKPLPDQSVVTSISGGTGTQTFKQIFVSLDKDIFHVKDNGFSEKDMVEYQYPANERFGVGNQDQIKDFYFVTTKYDAHNIELLETTGSLDPKTVAITVDRGEEITPTSATPIGLTAPITFAVTSGVLPTGLSLNTSTGSVTGTPVEVVEAPGREVVITATDANGTEVFQTHTYIINATVGSISPETVSRENIFADEAITPTPTPTTENLVDPIVWDISSNNLPTGLSLNTSTGVISGTPSEVIDEPGRDVIVRATDVGGLEAFQTVTFQINEPPELYSFSSATFTSGGRVGRIGPNLSESRNGVGNPSWATTYLQQAGFTGYLRWTVPADAIYRITAAGAQGGNSQGSAGPAAIIRGDFTLNEGEFLTIIVGQEGPDASYTGAGGASAVVRQSSDSPLIVAGGGASGNTGTGNSDSFGQMRTSGGQGNPDRAGGVNGQAGAAPRNEYNGGSGAGFYGQNTSRSGNFGGSGGQRYTSGFEGGVRGNYSGNASTEGGFGGGGGSGYGAGGAGGYSGGGPNSTAGSGASGGGGGGSFIATGVANPATSTGSWSRTGGEPDAAYGGSVSNIGSYNSGPGYVTIQKL